MDKPYLVVTAIGVDMFEAKCCQAIADGYWPNGQMQFISNTYHQVFLIREKKHV